MANVNSENFAKLARMGIVQSFFIFVSASVALVLETKYLIPFLARRTGQETIMFWFIVGGLGIFFPLIVVALMILRSEGYTLKRSVWIERLRFKSMSKTDWIWSVSSLVVIGISSALIMKGIEALVGNVAHSPSFMEFEPLTPGRYWLLAAWFPYWILNIMGEEILWRGVMLPRQEVAFGKWAWIVHAIGWGIFHIAFGWQLLLTLFPILIVQSYVVYKRKNSWVGVIIHAGLNGPSFIAIALGALG